MTRPRPSGRSGARVRVSRTRGGGSGRRRTARTGGRSDRGGSAAACRRRTRSGSGGSWCDRRRRLCAGRRRGSRAGRSRCRPSAARAPRGHVLTQLSVLLPVFGANSPASTSSTISAAKLRTIWTSIADSRIRPKNGFSRRSPAAAYPSLRSRDIRVEPCGSPCSGGRDGLPTLAKVLSHGLGVFLEALYLAAPETVDFRGFSMRPRGLEPPRTIQSTRPSTLRVYQFRHRRSGRPV